jgi:parvulin-like peptidyl-prolyl isomerase
MRLHFLRPGIPLLAAVFAVTGHSAPAGSAAPEVARIGTNSVPAGALRAAIARSGLPLNDAKTAGLALEELVTQEALAAEARRLGYDRDPEVVELTQRLMVQKLVAAEVDRKVSTTVPTDAELKAYYDGHVAEFSTPAMARGQVITLRVKGARGETEKFAAEAVALARTTPFGEVAKRYSDFANERLEGGETGWLSVELPGKRYPLAVVKALLELPQAGEVAAPVVTDQAIFVVKLTELRPAQTTPHEQVLPGLRTAVERDRRQQAYDALCERVKREHGVQVNAAAVRQVAAEPLNSSQPPPAPFRTP